MPFTPGNDTITERSGQECCKRLKLLTILVLTQCVFRASRGLAHLRTPTSWVDSSQISHFTIFNLLYPDHYIICYTLFQCDNTTVLGNCRFSCLHKWIIGNYSKRVNYNWIFLALAKRFCSMRTKTRKRYGCFALPRWRRKLESKVQFGLWMIRNLARLALIARVRDRTGCIERTRSITLCPCFSFLFTMLQYTLRTAYAKSIAVLLPVTPSAVSAIVLAVVARTTAGSASAEAVLRERFAAPVISAAQATCAKQTPAFTKQTDADIHTRGQNTLFLRFFTRF